SSLQSMEDKRRTLDASIKALDDSMLTELKEQEERISSAINRITTDLGMRRGQIRDASDRRREAEEERARIEKKAGKSNTSAGKLTLSRSVQSIFISIIEKLKKEELMKV